MPCARGVTYQGHMHKACKFQYVHTMRDIGSRFRCAIAEILKQQGNKSFMVIEKDQLKVFS